MKNADEKKEQQWCQLDGAQGQERKECWSTGLSVAVVIMTTLGVNVLLYLCGFFIVFKLLAI